MANMRKLSWFVDRLPGVRPRLARVAIKNGAVPGAMDDIHFMHGDLGPSLLVGPDAARLMLRAYREGALPMEPGRMPGSAPEAEAYVEHAASLVHEAEAHRRARIDADPFSDWRSMEEVFRRSGHPVPAKLDVDGVTVERKARDRQRDPRPDQIAFEWTDAAGRTWVLYRRGGPHPR